MAGMSFQFSPETIVIQFEEKIQEQAGIIDINRLLVDEKNLLIEPLRENLIVLVPSVTAQNYECLAVTFFFRREPAPERGGRSGHLPQPSPPLLFLSVGRCW